MKRRILGLFLVLSVMLSLCGCAENSNHNNVVADSRVLENGLDDTPISDAGIGDSDIVTELSPIDAPDNPVSSDVELDTSEDLIADIETNQEGLLLSWYGMDQIGYVFPIYNLNPDTGTIVEVARFVFPAETMSFGAGGMMPPDDDIFQRAIWFSNDYTKMAARYTDEENLEVRAGWVNVDGDFFDVVMATGEAHVGAFETPQKFNPIGFTKDDLFVYENVITGERRYVDVNDPTVSYAGDPFEGAYVTINKVDYYFTGQLSETIFILDTPKDGSQCYDLSTGEYTAYIPNDTRWNRNGRISPDGSNIAVVSWPINKQRDVDIYIMQINEYGDIDSSTATKVQFVSPDLSVVLDNFVLLDWR